MSTSGVKRLYRSRKDRMIGGVAAGLGEYLGIDVTVVRLIFLLGAIFGVGSFLIIYIVMLIIVPEEPLTSEAVMQAEPPAEAAPRRATRRKTTAAKKSAAKKPAAKKSA